MPTFYRFNANEPGQGNQIFYSFDDVFVPFDLFSFGNILAWGSNSFGQLGVNDNNIKTSPSQVYYSLVDWKKISSGTDFAAGLRSDGTIWTWGNGEFGKLGNGSTNSSNVPIVLSSQGTNWEEVSCGSRHMGAIKSDGSLFLWGNGDFGQLGRSISDPSSLPIRESTNSNYWRKLSCGEDYNFAISQDNNLWSWGLNTYGQLGSGNTNNRSIPTFVSSGWKQVSSGQFHTAAITTSGNLRATGRNNYGQLGDGTTTNRSSFVTIGSQTNWKQVSCNGYHTAAVRTDGTIWSWGLNDVGQLGHGDTTNRSSPTQIGSDINWKQVYCGKYNTIAVKTDGSLWVWGDNLNNTIGLGTEANSII